MNKGVIGNVVFDVLPKPDKYGIKWPCSKTFYETRFAPFLHQSMHVEHTAVFRPVYFRMHDPNFPSRAIYPFYDSVTVEKQYERLIYDLPGFLSALGGSIGLYLGLSCVSVIYTFVDALSATIATRTGAARSRK